MFKIFNVKNAQATIAELTKSNTEWATKYSDLEKKLTDTVATYANFAEEKKNFDAKVEASNKEHQSEVEKLKAEIESTKVSVNKVVTAELASIGIPEAIKEEAPSSKLTPKVALAQMKELKGKAKDEFYNKHRSLILQVSRVEQSQ